MAAQSVTTTAGNTSSPLYIDLQKLHRGVALICTVHSISGTYTVQVSGDPLPGPPTHWNNHDYIVAQSANMNSNLAYPATAVRLNCGSIDSGSVTLAVVQADLPSLSTV